jgi:hypothetical protein
VPVALVSQGGGITKESYDETIRRLTGGKKTRADSPADWPVEGLLVHVAGEAEGGFRVVDVWESEEALRRFLETLAPILQELGAEGEPEIYPTHAFVSA